MKFSNLSISILVISRILGDRSKKNNLVQLLIIKCSSCGSFNCLGEKTGCRFASQCPISP